MNIITSNISFKQKKEYLNKMIYNVRYEQAVEKLDLSYLNFKWKAYFFFVKNKYINLIYAMLFIINKKHSR